MHREDPFYEEIRLEWRGSSQACTQKPVLSLCTNQEFVNETRQFVILTAVADTTLSPGTPMCASRPVDTGSATGELESHQGFTLLFSLPLKGSGLFQSFP